MKGCFKILVNALVCGLLVSTSSNAATGYEIAAAAISEPIFLTLCGGLLIFLGMYSSAEKN